MVFRRQDRFLIALTYGRESQWVQNVLSAGGCELETTGRTMRLTQPHIIHDEQRRMMPSFVRAILGLLNVSDFLEMSVATEATRRRLDVA
jgi:hypothetical protein